MSELPAIAFIGIGNMGWPMAAKLRAAGYPLRVYDLDAGRCRAFAAETGAAVADSPAQVAQAAIVITMLPTGASVRQVLCEAAEGAFLAQAAPGTVVVDMSSSEPPGTRELGRLLAERGLVLLDAPVSGAVPRARLGTLTIMLGGDDGAAMDRVRPVLMAMGDRVFDTGGLGSGHAAKALNNYIAAATYTATAEAVLAARRFGLDPATLINIVNASTGQSFISAKVMGEHVLEQRYATGFALGLLAKDVGIAADLAAAVGLDAPLTRLVRERWAQARDRLGAGADNSEAIKGWDQDLHGTREG